MNFIFKSNDVNESLPLLYRIGIGSRYFYIGCADNASRPKKDYSRNLTRMLTGKPYRKSNPDGFREIHRRLLEASDSGEEITIELLRNVPVDSKFEEERLEIIAHRRIHGEGLLNGTDLD